MEREFHEHGHGHDHGNHGFPSSDNAGNVGITIGDLGMSLAMGPVPNVAAVGAKLRGGTKVMEIGFFGMGKGSGQGHTPEMYGEKQRTALVEIGRANKVDFTTHTSVGVYGLAGMDQQGNFSKSQKNFSLTEIKRAIEFASDVGQGGPVVVHTGEFQRPVVDAEWNEHKDDPYYKKFKMHPDEEGRTSYRVVDTRTGAVIQEARKNRSVSKPVWNMAKEGQEYIDFDGTKKVATGREKEEGQRVYIDYFGNRLKADQRVPEFDYKAGHFKIEQMDWRKMEEEAQEMTKRAREEWKKWKSGKLTDQQKKESLWRERVFKDTIKDEKQIEVKPEEAYIISTLETNAANSRGWSLQYGGNFEEYVESLKKLKKAKELYVKIEKETTDPEQKELLKHQVNSLAGGLVPPESKFPTEIIDKQIKELERHITQAREAASSQWAQSEEAMEQIRHVQSAESYALNEAYDAYAMAAMTAMKHTENLEKQGKLKKPIAIALENLFPESYGAHPDELIKLVHGSRERMVQVLKNQYPGISDKEAWKRAETHITATFDTGHLNMWRKYWVGDDKKSIQQNNDDFNKWMLKKIEEMVDKNIMGHVHIDDNQGYQDEHLAPGEGNTPIKEMVELLKRKGYKGELIIEPGADYYTDLSGFHSVMKTWRYMDLPVYGRGSGVGGGGGRRGRSWGQVGYGYFGQTVPPYFTVGAYVPSEDWSLWSGVPLE
jgi:sugar phosphate isomerase/epimerase